VSNKLTFLFGRYQFRFSTLTQSILRLHCSCFQCLQTNYRIAPVPKIDRMLTSSTMYNRFNSHSYSKTKKYRDSDSEMSRHNAPRPTCWQTLNHRTLSYCCMCRGARQKVGQSRTQCYYWTRTRNILIGCGDAVKWKGWKELMRHDDCLPVRYWASLWPSTQEVTNDGYDITVIVVFTFSRQLWNCMSVVERST